MARRKHISWKTKCAAAVLDAYMMRERFGLHSKRWYEEAKKLSEDQFLSLFQWDHNILHETMAPDVDVYWNLQPMLIWEHNRKTKRDAKVIAKGRRIRRKLKPMTQEERELAYGYMVIERANRKIRSRGFDKTRKRKMDGTVVKR